VTAEYQHGGPEIVDKGGQGGPRNRETTLKGQKPLRKRSPRPPTSTISGRPGPPRRRNALKSTVPRMGRDGRSCLLTWSSALGLHGPSLPARPTKQKIFCRASDKDAPDDRAEAKPQTTYKETPPARQRAKPTHKEAGRGNHLAQATMQHTDESAAVRQTANRHEDPRQSALHIDDLRARRRCAKTRATDESAAVRQTANRHEDPRQCTHHIDDLRARRRCAKTRATT